MIKVNISGELRSTAGNIMAKSFRDTGLKVTHWYDCSGVDRKPQNAARLERADVLIMEMRSAKAKKLPAKRRKA